MYEVKIFRGARAGQTKRYATLKQAMRARDRYDEEYGACCTNWPKKVD